MALSTFKNFQAASRRPCLIPFGLLPQGSDLSWIPSYGNAPDDEVPAGTVDGTNAAFTVSRPFTKISVFLNGLKLKEGTGYDVAGLVVTFKAGYIPQSGDTVEVEVW